jgi:spermidine/putrescine transport system ATP-binding protein
LKESGKENNRLIELKRIYKKFDQPVLKDVNLYIRKNEFITLLGPSGCGKTTILRIIGGFETPTSGELLFEGNDILKVPPHKRRVNTVFQSYALFPHMNVAENIAFGLKIRKVDKSIIDKKVRAMLELVSLSGYEKRSVRSLSGGQQQRIAIARALANEPEALLLDEPFGALDLKLREEMQIELKNIQRELGITFIHVTHDQEEALTMSDTVVVLKDGIIQQIGTPKDIYDEPDNVFVANFIGKSNITTATMIGDFKVNIAGTVFECLDKGFGENKPVDVVIRPEDIHIVSPENGQIAGVVKDITFNGSHYAIYVDTPAGTWSVWSTAAAAVGAKVGLNMIPDAIHVMNRTKTENDEQPPDSEAEEEQLKGRALPVRELLDK